jgi:hypothetical protein
MLLLGRKWWQRWRLVIPSIWVCLRCSCGRALLIRLQWFRRRSRRLRRGRRPHLRASPFSRGWRDRRRCRRGGRGERIVLLLLRPNRRFFPKDGSQHSEKVVYGRFLRRPPSAALPSLTSITTHVPVLLPLRQVGVVYLPVAANMLSWPHQHLRRGSHVDDGRLPRVGVWHPYRDGDAIGCAAKGNGEGPAEQE